MPKRETENQVILRPAAERLLDAAVEVFTREGIGCATTREIAKAAGVNEVTLFRNFQNRQGLLTAVLERAFLSPGQNIERPSIEKGAPLEDVLSHFALADFQRKQKNIQLMRVLVGELHRLGEHESEVLRRIFRPWKEELATELRSAQKHGQMREDADPVIIVDQLVAMIFIGVLRADVAVCVEYTPETYLKACVETILRAITPAGGKEQA